MDGVFKAVALLLLHLGFSVAVQVLGPINGALSVHFPKESGCYVRTPSGCPNHPSFNSYDWKHELYGELYKNAKVDGEMCEVKRRRHVNTWCGNDDVEMLFIPPLEQGCYFRLPTGCPRHPLFNATKWKREAYGETYRKAKENRTVCEQARKVFLQGWCGTKEVQMLFVAPDYQGLAPLAGRLSHRGNPQEPGCFMRTPKGCQNPNYYTVDWKHDVFAERYTWANVNRTACEVLRKERVAEFCGNKVEAKFVSAGSVSPAEPGCFVRASEGCPKHPDFGAEWVLDPLSENSTEVRENRTLCEVERKERMVEWCGTITVETYFIPPLEGGCYMRTPSGCPNNPAFGSLAWRHEEFGEKFTDAKTNRTVCEIARKERLATICGADDAETLFVPGAAVDEERLEAPDNDTIVVPGATAEETILIPEAERPGAEMQDEEEEEPDEDGDSGAEAPAAAADAFDARLIRDLPSADGGVDGYRAQAEAEAAEAPGAADSPVEAEGASARGTDAIEEDAVSTSPNAAADV